ncbi:serine/threonine protein kinase [Gloeomargarita lithophora Alchichica-D10]|uniref:Serine/threonine protein kinase n=1 Tax=Gloeomargarita lithophora Alchichica-D10 TaxID=1188229 RepID=A0A1J0AGJ4_9CYAN|nr:serine/threonine-protein kinase [Gloeomargarita lithophora]APB35024.1 serine/threonine protein kinase [Gloeomargarita lithophora Alchichica-D10]
MQETDATFTPTWDVLTESVQSLVVAWEQSVPDLRDFVPDVALALQSLVLVELVKTDLAYRWQKGLGQLLEAYQTQYPELGAELPCDLILHEYYVRTKHDPQVSVEDYYERFPAQKEALTRLLDKTEVVVSTALVTATAPQGSAPPIQVGDEVAGFEVVQELGRGAFAQVFLARQPTMQRWVALKVSPEQGAEPQTLALLDHPHIVRVFDQHLLPERGLRLMYMQCILGGTLAGVIEQVTSVPPEQRAGGLVLAAVDGAMNRVGQAPWGDEWRRRQWAELSWVTVVARWGMQLAGALAYAQQQGVLHRDVKPANILLGADGTPYLADFNISYASPVVGATPAAYFGGSLAYMSPEQLAAANPYDPWQPEQLDGRSDLYALAVVLWEVLYGERPFVETGLAKDWITMLNQRWQQRQQVPPVPPAAAELGMGAQELTWVLQSCLAPERELRPVNGQDLARQLSLCLRPQTFRFLRSQPSPWQRWSLLIFALAALLPHALAGWFNYVCNWREIISHLAGATAAWERLALMVNSIAYPLGLVALLLTVWPTVRAMGQIPPPSERVGIRLRSLGIGQVVAGIGLLEWGLAAVVYPVGLAALVPDFPAQALVQFVLSLALCGLVAAAYPFFFCSSYVLRVVYPRLIPPLPEPAEAARCEQLQRWAGVYLFLAGMVAPGSVGLLVWSGLNDPWLLGVVSGVGLLGFGLAFVLYRGLQEDLQALISVSASLLPGLEQI